MKFKYLLLFLIVPFFTYGQKKAVNNGYEKGLLLNGYKTGVWQYYDNNRLIFKVDYSTGKLLYLAKDTSRYVIKTDKGWKLSKLDIYPHYLGSDDEILRTVAVNLRYPEKARRKSIIGTVLLSFEINLQGKADSARIIHDIGGGCGKEVLRVFHLVPNYWLVARKGGKKYIARYVLPVRFQIGSGSSRSNTVWKKVSLHEKQALAQAKTTVYPTRYLETIVVSALGGD